MRFDRKHGTDTEEMMAAGEFGQLFSGGGRADASSRRVYAYQTSPEEIIRQPLRLNVPDDCRDFVFVDLGCGKGKPLLIASHYRFARILGKRPRQ